MNQFKLNKKLDCYEMELHDKFFNHIGDALVDICDYDKVKDWNWTLNNEGYIVGRHPITKERSRMSKVILGLENTRIKVKYSNGDKFDNRRSNLDSGDVKKKIENSRRTDIKGVTEKNGNYEVTISYKGKRTYLGSSKDKTEALIMRKRAEYALNQQKEIKKAAKETNGEAVLYDNKLIDALFFSTSNGYTENSLDVFSSDLPYLVSVESKWDKKESPAFSSTNEFTKKEFLYNLGLNIDSDIKIDNIVRTNSKRVKEITINNKKYTGREIRKIFGLKSTSFDIKLDNEKVTFNVNGFGHGVGLSQYGANGMAKEGYNYKQILTYYYKNCVIKKIN